MIRRLTSLLIAVILCSCASSGPLTVPNDREWNLLTADHSWLETLRKAQPAPPANASRKKQIETLLENHRKVEPVYVAFMDKLREYHTRTGDPRAAALMAKEKIAIGDDYMNILARYDRALEFYRTARQIDPANPDVQQRIAIAEQRRFVAMTTFAQIKSGMKEDDVRKLVGLPREDWIKQVIQNNRVYAVWIYPKADGGAAAIYFDNGVVYHTNWNAAAASPQQAANE
ncbi:MAG TPA: hypothetical protein VFL80_12005 [Thermoanaerobaculia bacterium]|nr:hypothetical protein [Thermoanaerobaculia bacterium]